MAIRGDFIFKKWVQTGVEEETHIVPEDVLETDPNYDKRGEEVVIERPIGEVQDDPENTFINHIIAINSCGLHSEKATPDNKIWNVAIIWAIYENEEDRANSRNVVKSGEITRWDGIDFNEVENVGIYEYCYNYLKNEDWITNATDI